MPDESMGTSFDRLGPKEILQNLWGEHQRAILRKESESLPNFSLWMHLIPFRDSHNAHLPKVFLGLDEQQEKAESHLKLSKINADRV